jgi:hypothetical protein
VCGGDASLLGDDLSSEKKKREKAPAGKAQISTTLMMAEGYSKSRGKKPAALEKIERCTRRI